MKTVETVEIELSFDEDPARLVRLLELLHWDAIVAEPTEKVGTG